MVAGAMAGVTGPISSDGHGFTFVNTAGNTASETVPPWMPNPGWPPTVGAGIELVERSIDFP